MTTDSDDTAMEPTPRKRADAQRSIEVLLAAAKTVFAQAGVDAPVREIARQAGVGVGTLYRNFPTRADLIAAVFRREVDDCEASAHALIAAHTPVVALAEWLQRYAQFIAVKRGLAKALYSGDPAYDSLRGYFRQRLHPVLQAMLDRATASGAIRTDLDADDILGAVASLGATASNDRPDQASKLVSVFIDGLRHGAGQA